MTPEQIRKSVAYTRALDSLKVGNSIATTTEMILQGHMRKLVNEDVGYLVSLALVVQQAYNDIQPIEIKRTTF